VHTSLRRHPRVAICGRRHRGGTGPRGDGVRTVARRRGYRGRCAIVIGHSNTVPDIVHRLAPDVNVPAMGEGEYDTVYIVTLPTFGPAAVLRLKY